MDIVNDVSHRKVSAFRRLHDARAGFVMPNAWDAGSAVVLADAGFAALATTSAGIAFSLGRADHALPRGATQIARETMMERVAQITAAVDLPVNGDLENGYGNQPEDVAETIRLGMQAGLAGANIEDFAGGTLYDEELAVARIAAARDVIDSANSDFVLTARTDGRLLPVAASLDDCIRRLKRYREAGAECLYAPGVNDLDDLERLVNEVGAPLNVVAGLGDTRLTVPSLRSIGATRISLGGSIARAVLGFIREAAQELLGPGTLSFARNQIPQPELNALFTART
jgi:2-methylisocitrate lyase-like PEP mutase family enzyme